jgi:hypothetical protein
MENKARYDNYRLVRVFLDKEDHVKLFQEIEAESDSYTFYGHARKIGQELMIMIASHKIYEFSDLVERYGLKYVLLVRIYL